MRPSDVPRDDRIFRFTRGVAAFIVVVLLTAFVTLYVWPDRTAELFAWPINPPLTAMLMGSGYLAGAYFFSRVLTAPRWHWVSYGVLPITPFTIAMALATVLHWDKFTHTHPAFWLWAVVYTLTPFLVPYVWWRNQVTDPGTPDADDVRVPAWVRWALAVVSGGQLVVGLLLFFAPEQIIPLWPWKLTPLTARVVGGWFMLPGTGGVLIARDPRWSAARVTLEGTMIWVTFLLIGMARDWGSLDQANPFTWGYIGLLVSTLVGVPVLYAYMEAQRRKRGQVAQPAV